MKLLILSLVIVISALTLESKTQVVEFEEIDRGSAMSYNVERGAHVEYIANEENWKKVWDGIHYGVFNSEGKSIIPERPDIDFSKEVVVIAFSDRAGSAGIPIRITEIEIDSRQNWFPRRVEVNFTFFVLGVIRPASVERTYQAVKYRKP